MLIPLSYVIYFFVHNKTRLNMQKLHNTYWRNCHGFYSNYIHSKHDTRMFMVNAPILPLVSFWQHNVHFFKNPNQGWGPGNNSTPKQMVICQNRANANSIVQSLINVHSILRQRIVYSQPECFVYSFHSH